MCINYKQENVHTYSNKNTPTLSNFLTGLICKIGFYLEWEENSLWSPDIYMDTRHNTITNNNSKKKENSMYWTPNTPLMSIANGGK
jgi:hypothetical protein